MIAGQGVMRMRRAVMLVVAMASTSGCMAMAEGVREALFHTKDRERRWAQHETDYNAFLAKEVAACTPQMRERWQDAQRPRPGMEYSEVRCAAYKVACPIVDDSTTHESRGGPFVSYWRLAQLGGAHCYTVRFSDGVATDVMTR